METKKWYQSKMVWVAIITTVMGILPLIAAAVKAISPEGAITIDAIVATVGGVLQVILRVWFTSTPIETSSN